MQLGKKKNNNPSAVIIWKAGNVSNRTVALTYKVWKVNVVMRVRYYAALDIILPARNELRKKKKKQTCLFSRKDMKEIRILNI